MKTNLLTSTLILAATTLLAADPKDEVKDAAKKLAEKLNYSWRTTSESAGGGNFQIGPIEGKTEKDGATYVKISRGDNSTEAVMKGTKGAIKMNDGDWRSLADAAGDDQGGGNRGRFAARMFQNFKAPAADAEDIAGKVGDLKSSDGVYSGNLTESGAKSLLTFRRGGGGNGPEVSDAKGSAKFWIKDGVLAKFQYNVKGTVSFNGNDRDVDRTTTVEIKEVGSTKVSIPEEAEKKL